ncbi:MAG TPA: hypothetical protein VII11_07695 [Bacteroidota bacterium]
MRTFKHIQQYLVRALLALVMLWLPACDLIDPSEVENPAITADNLLGNPNGGTTALVSGLKRYFSNTIGPTALIGDLVSDNLDNRTSFYDNTLTFPRTVTPKSFTYTDVYLNGQRLKALADFGLSAIIPNDVLATNAQKSEVHFYRGMALLLLAERFTNFPLTEKGDPVTAAAALQEAVSSLNTAFGLTTANAMITNIRLAKARAYRLLGDKTNAATEANAALAISGGATYVFSAPFEQSNQATVHQAMVSRTSNDIQPNPRLDFLDPKYTTTATSVPVLKAEEAHLILAEIALSNNDLAAAKTSMKNAITVARGRATLQYNDRDARTGRPNDSTMTVAYEAGATPVAGLIKKRGGTSIVTVYPTSGTSLTTANIDALVSKYDHIYTLYLLRQQIFFLEGRRMTDLGIRLPVPQRQIDGNAKVVDGSVGTVVTVPGHIPQSDEMRKYSTAGTVVTIQWDMNKVIAQNIGSVSPLGVTP